MMRDTSLGPSMTPMVDVVLVILIFFMASTAFLGPEWLLRASLLREGSAAAGPGAFTLPPARFDIRVRVDDQGRTVVDGLGERGASVERACRRIAEYAARLGPERVAVVVEPDALVPYRDVVALHEACAEAGIAVAGLR